MCYKRKGNFGRSSFGDKADLIKCSPHPCPHPAQLFKVEKPSPLLCTDTPRQGTGRVPGILKIQNVNTKSLPQRQVCISSKPAFESRDAVLLTKSPVPTRGGWVGALGINKLGQMGADPLSDSSNATSPSRGVKLRPAKFSLLRLSRRSQSWQTLPFLPPPPSALSDMIKGGSLPSSSHSEAPISYLI